MKTSVYETIVAYIKRHRCRPHLGQIAQDFPDIDKDTLGSICSFEYQKKLKKGYRRLCYPEVISDLYRRYCQRQNDGEDVLLKLAEEVDLSPAHMARIILEQYLLLKDLINDGQTKSTLGRYLKDTSLIPDPILACQIDLCNLNDEYYGVIVDTIKHSIGQEYEVILKKAVKEKNLPFQDEDQMRLKGYDKTPDVKLEVPIAVDGHVVNWIESKASFGDAISHQGYLKDQFWSYWNRFGPGMVIYWFGFIDELDTNRDKGIILKDHFPENIVKMNPLCLATS